MKKISFNNSNNIFYTTLREKVEQYFEKTKKKTTGNARLYWKAAILMLLAGVTYSLLLFVPIPGFVSILLCISFGLNLAAIGFNVMHDGNHGSFSSRKSVNKIMGLTLNVMGGSDFLWKVKHNYNHHSFTNIEGMDDDIDIKPFIRTNLNQRRYWIHRFQNIYWVFFYGLTYLSWVFMNDYQKYFSGKISDTKFRKMTTSEHLYFWISKIVYYSVFILIPILTVGWLYWLIGYSIVAFACGLTLGVVFQMAHIVEETNFPLADNGTNRIEQEWAIHQVETTANFSTRSKWISWFTGGLNFQVEHHLFPKISHIHYPAINKIVKETCAEFNIAYNEFPNFFSALKSHVNHLKNIGTA